jgi:hypothetical protein
VKNAKIRIAVVPFANYVALPTSYRNVPWMDVPPDYVVHHPQVCNTSRPVTSRSDCTTSTSNQCSGGHTTYNDGVPTTHPRTCGPRTTTTCANVEYGDPVTTCYTPPPTYYKWFGLVASRLNNYHKIAAFDGKPIPGLLEDASAARIAPSTILPLTDNFSSVRSKINSLVAKGETYIPSGLIWGWRAVTTYEPLTQAAGNQGDRTVNAIVLMTDGKNTRSLTAPRHDGYDEAAANGLTKELCEKINAEDIYIYTVAYRFPYAGSSTRQILKDCATEDDMFFDANNAAQLQRAFDAIAISLYSTRISS